MIAVITRPVLPQILPAQVSRDLRQAARTINTPKDPMARSRAIEEVLRRARLMHPECFREDEET